MLIDLELIKPKGKYPSCVQTTLASDVLQLLEQTVPQTSLTHTSTLPS